VHRSTNQARAIRVGKQLAAAVRAWGKHADAEEKERGYEGLNVGAAWTKDGLLVVVARRDTAHRLDALLRDEDIARPQGRQDDLASAESAA